MPRSILLLVLVFLIGCAERPSSPQATDGSAAPQNASPRQAVVIQLNWYPEAEHGGAYAALASGTYEQAGLEVEIRSGGPATPVAADLESGRCQFAFANADDVALYRQQGAGVVAVLAAMQNHPRCILVRADSGITSLQDLEGITLQRQPGRPFLEFMRKRGLLEGVQEVPYTGSVAALVNSPKVAIQAYSFAEPLLAQQQGVEVRTLMVSELGWNPYSSVLVTTEELIQNDPQLVRQVVQATQQGWQQYLENPEPANQLILQANRQGMTKEALTFGASELEELALPGGAAVESVGQMSLERWQTLVDQLVDLNLVDRENVTAEECFNVDFLTESTTAGLEK